MNVFTTKNIKRVHTDPFTKERKQNGERVL